MAIEVSTELNKNHSATSNSNKMVSWRNRTDLMYFFSNMTVVECRRIIEGRIMAELLPDYFALNCSVKSLVHYFVRVVNSRSWRLRFRQHWTKTIPRPAP